MTEIERLREALADTERKWREEKAMKDALPKLISKHFAPVSTKHAPIEQD
jgi:hypothetical protein